MRLVLVAFVLVTACKEKQSAKPAPAPEAKTQAATPPPALPEQQAGNDKPGAAPVPIKPAGGFNTAEDYEKKAFELMDKLASAFSAAGTDCEKLADNLEVFAHDNKAVVDNTNAFEKENPTAEEALQAKMADRSRQFMLKVKVTLDKCGKHERVRAALGNPVFASSTPAQP